MPFNNTIPPSCPRTCVLHELACTRLSVTRCMDLRGASLVVVGSSLGPLVIPRSPKFSLTHHSQKAYQDGGRGTTRTVRACLAVHLQPHLIAPCRWIDLTRRGSGKLVQHASTLFAQAGRGLVVARVDIFTPLIFRDPHPAHHAYRATPAGLSWRAKMCVGARLGTLCWADPIFRLELKCTHFGHHGRQVQ